jgi:hypothetical protein
MAQEAFPVKAHLLRKSLVKGHILEAGKQGIP